MTDPRPKLDGLKPASNAAEKAQQLKETLGKIEGREGLRRDFAKNANDYHKWTVEAFSTIDERFAAIDGKEIGTTKETYDQYGQLLLKDDDRWRKQSKEKIDALEKITKDLEALGVKRSDDNEYTYWTIDDMPKMNENLEKTIALRQEAYKKELLEISQTDGIEKEFADIAAAFILYCNSMREMIDKPQEKDPKANREKVRKEWDERKPITEKYQKAEELDKQLKDKGVTNNKHTKTTLTDLRTVHRDPTTVYVEAYIAQGDEDDKALEGLRFKAEQLVKWMVETKPRFVSYEFNNVLDDTLKQYDQLRTFRSEEKPPKEKERKVIIATRDAINHSNEIHKRPPFVPEKNSPEAIFQQLWDELTDLVLDYEEDLRDEIRRLLALENLVQYFNHEAREMIQWIKEKDEFISDQSHKSLDSRGATKSEIAKMNMFHVEYEDRQKDLQNLTEIGKKISEENYYKFADIQATYHEIVIGWAGLKKTAPLPDLPTPKPGEKRGKVNGVRKTADGTKANNSGPGQTANIGQGTQPGVAAAGVAAAGGKDQGQPAAKKWGPPAK